MAHSRTRAPQPMVTIKQHWGKQFRDDEDEDDEEGNRYGQTVDGEDNMLGRTCEEDDRATNRAAPKIRKSSHRAIDEEDN
ncbi:hypothetical protein E4U35_008462 [Claviceps purpurea]|nr:hypothetical protein E4U12_000661 [Claviceps purpurea]KAG6165703.1 hypothetical protein E4U27_008358 [Claviceps purpurea]KAG6177583.1 hypothetical protein E4U10_000161 [Claviceps purpurea]KAG6195363.1 hypothetical protein E4U35_008462 [Claviceps purpurea]